MNAVPAAHSKGLLDQPHPGNSPAVAPMEVSQQGGADNSDVSDDEVAEAADQGRAANTAAPGRGGDELASKL